MATKETLSVDHGVMLQEMVREHGYGENDYLLGYLTQVLMALQEQVPFDDWKDKKVLDVACGNSAPTDPIEDQIREATFAFNPSSRWLHELGLKCRQPWVCRILSRLGANVTGVDWKYPRYEKHNGVWQGCAESGWHFVQRDLTAPGAMSPCADFPSNHYDLVHCRDFLGREAVAAPEMMTLRNRNPRAYMEIEEAVLSQCARVLKPDGIFVWNEKPFRRRGLRFLPHDKK